MPSSAKANATTNAVSVTIVSPELDLTTASEIPAPDTTSIRRTVACSARLYGSNETPDNDNRHYAVERIEHTLADCLGKAANKFSRQSRGHGCTPAREASPKRCRMKEV
jgi:hypothetical protein